MPHSPPLPTQPLRLLLVVSAQHNLAIFFSGGWCPPPLYSPWKCKELMKILCGLLYIHRVVHKESSLFLYCYCN